MTISKIFQTVKFVLTVEWDPVEYSISILNHGIYNQSYEFKCFWKNKTKLDFLHGDLSYKINLCEMKVNAFHVEKNNFIKKTCLQKERFRADKWANTYLLSLLSKLSKKSIEIECHGVVQREKHGDFRIRTFVIRKNF